MAQVSVIIPAYNASATIAETLHSLLNQSFPDFDVIVVDDGSTDDTVSVVDAVGDPRVRVLSVSNGGVARARNRGVAASSGALVAFLDADDLWEPEKLARQVDALERLPDAGFCVTGSFRIDGESRVLATQPLQRPEDVCRTLLLEAMCVGYISSGLARRTTFDAVGGFNPEFSYCADWDLWLRLGAATQFAVLEQPLMSYRTTAGNMSSNGALLEHDTFAVLDAFFATADAVPYGPLKRHSYSNQWMFCAGSYLHQRRPSDAIRCLAHGLALYPANARRPIGMPARWISRAVRTSGPPDGH